MGRVILISNRLPITVRRVEKRTVVTRSAGGLVAGLGPIHDATEGLWVGTTGGAEAPTRELERQRLVAVDLPREVARRHYEGYSNQTLWPLFHYLLDHVIFQRRAFLAYRAVNERFADTVASLARPGDSIWVHDYHLMLLPAMLRERIPGVQIGFFLHIPFPSSEVFRILPRKEEILQGLLGADLIGVHTYDYARHLVSCFRRVLGVEFDEDWVRSLDGACRVGVFPLGVDAEGLEAQARDPAVESRAEKLRERMQGRKVILGVDRLDYTKGIPLRLRAYRRLLQLQPSWTREAVLLQLAVPSRSSIPAYRALKEEVERAVGEINGAFTQEGVAPIDYMYRSVPPEELAAMYRLADIAWVTPIRDGMNLVAKEYVAHRHDNTGVLVLSEFAGAASEMGEALFHNPWDVEGTAAVLGQALEMDPDEMGERMSALRTRIRASNVHRWAQRFLEALERQGKASRGPETADSVLHATPGWLQELLAVFGASNRPLVALDYDGTLTELMGRPEHATPSPDTLEILERLSAVPHLELIIISGRDPDTLEDWFQHRDLSMVAEHGLFYRMRGETEWSTLLERLDTSWMHAVHEVMHEYAARCPGSLIEQKTASVAWHYRQVAPALGSWQARELGQHLAEAFANTPLEVLHGSKVIEVRPQGLDKGHAYRLLRQKLGPFDFEMAAGDDTTDENMFQALGSAGWAIKVGRGLTHARIRVSSPEELRAVLTRLADSRD